MASPYTTLFPKFTPRTISVPSSSSTTTPVSISIHTLTAGTGPPLLLIHGFPQNLSIWHKVTPHLLSTYTLILIDLRGYGQSSKPDGGEEFVNYSKTNMARDCAEVMQELGHERFYLCAHDRGARVGHKLCVDYPDRVIKAIFLDIAPTLAMYEKTDFAFAKAYWHWYFLIQKSPLPESLMLGNPRGYIEGTMGGRYGVGLEVFDEVALETYVKQMGDKECVHGMCEDYRAAASVDLEEQRKDLEVGKKIKCPLRVLWGKKGVIEAQFDALKEWRKVSDGIVDGETVDSGHYIPEEVPDILIRYIKEYCVD